MRLKPNVLANGEVSEPRTPTRLLYLRMLFHPGGSERACNKQSFAGQNGASASRYIQ